MSPAQFATVDSSRVLGIDTSHWTGVVDWQKAKANGIKFAIIKGANNLSNQIRFFKENYQGAKDAGLLVGAYTWLYPSVSSDPAAQARVFIDLLEDHPVDIPACVDFEWTAAPRNPNTTDLSKFIKAFEDGYGRPPMIYTSIGYWSEFGSTKTTWTRYPIWQAHYTASTLAPIKPWSGYDFLQWTEGGNGDFYGAPDEASVDLDYWKGTLDELLAFCNKPVNGTPSPEPDKVIMTVRPLYPNVNRRSGPGMSFGVVGQLDITKSYDIVEVQGSWGRIAGPNREWTHLDYVQKVSTEPQPILKFVKTSFTNLRIRSKPNTDGAILGFMTANQPYGIVKLSGEWGRLEGPAEQWVNLGFTTDT